MLLLLLNGIADLTEPVVNLKYFIFNGEQSELCYILKYSVYYVRICSCLTTVQQNTERVHVLVITSKLVYSLPSARQHPSYGDCLEVKSEYYQNCSVLDCVTQCSQSAAHLCEQFLQVQ